MVVQLCCATNRWTPLLEFILVGFCVTPPTGGVTDPSKYVPGHTGLAHPFSQLSRSVLLVRLRETNTMSNKHYLLCKYMKIHSFYRKLCPIMSRKVSQFLQKVRLQCSLLLDILAHICLSMLMTKLYG
jgi:hypothetical protein